MKKKAAVLLTLFALLVNCSFVEPVFAKQGASKQVRLKLTIKNKITGKLIGDKLVVGIGLNTPGVVSHRFRAENGKIEIPIITDGPSIYLEIKEDGYRPYSKNIDVKATSKDINVLLEPAKQHCSLREPWNRGIKIYTWLLRLGCWDEVECKL
jgi:hypothetical protein